jgi:hypothetical protein
MSRLQHDSPALVCLKMSVRLTFKASCCSRPRYFDCHSPSSPHSLLTLFSRAMAANTGLIHLPGITSHRYCKYLIYRGPKCSSRQPSSHSSPSKQQLLPRPNAAHGTSRSPCGRSSNGHSPCGRSTTTSTHEPQNRVRPCGS